MQWSFLLCVSFWCCNWNKDCVIRTVAGSFHAPLCMRCEVRISACADSPNCAYVTLLVAGSYLLTRCWSMSTKNRTPVSASQWGPSPCTTGSVTAVTVGSAHARKLQNKHSRLREELNQIISQTKWLTSWNAVIREKLKSLTWSRNSLNIGNDSG